VPLCSGGTAVIVDNALSLLAEPPDVTMVCWVPSAARALVTANALPHSVRVVGLAGELTTGTLVDDLYATGHVVDVVNMYGPTEDTTYSTFARVQPGEQPPPIGVLMPHGRGYVLDRALRPVPVGAVGEMYLAGRGLSLGYLGKPGMTASRFVADPFAAPGERMYRTGDLVRYRADGALLFVGRRDFQVKVRGQRIELGEIETTLQRHPDVRDAVVALHTDRLVGYLTARTAAGLDLDDVRAYLRRTLPVVMVPSSLVVLDELPHTPNGKVDRLSLPAPDAPVSMGGGPPRGPDEELVAEVWRQVLELDDIGRDDDFFDLGGDSLLAGQVLNRLRERAGTGLSLRLVFENSRLADLAAALPPPAAGPPDRSAVTVRPPDAEPVLSFDQLRLWLECQLKSNVAYNLHGRRWLRGEIDIAALDRSIRAIISRHETLRTTFPLVGGRPVQRVAPPDPRWRVTVTDLSTLDSDRVRTAERLADQQAATPFDLAAGPLFACLVVRLSDTEHLLSMTIHHLISDAWSIGLFLRELSALYRAGGDADGADLPALPVQYLDYAVWQRDRLTGDRLTAQVDYWRDRLAGAPPALTLPVTRRRLPSQGTLGGRVLATLHADETAAVHRLCREHDVTPFMAMVAALATVLRRWTGQDDVVIGVPVNTRRDAGTDALIGFFVNTVPLRIESAGDPAFGKLLGRVRQASLDGYVNHGETPFDVLVRELRVVRDPSRTPLFQVLLAMVDTAEEEWRLPGIEVQTPAHPTQPSKFDLNLNVHHIGGAFELELLYHADRYEDPMMRAFVDQVAAVLVAAAADPTRGILEYELPGPTLVHPVPPLAVPTPHRAVERQARQRPDRIAVVDRNGALTYRQLAEAVERIAALVAGAGRATTGAGEPDAGAGESDAGAVAVVKRRSAAFAAAVLGCVRAGVPYTIVEPGAEAAGSTVLDPAALDAVLDPAVPDPAVLDAAVPDAAVPDPGAAEAEPADWAVERFELTGGDRVAVLSGAAGLLTAGLSAAVGAGASLVVADDATLADPDALLKWLRGNSVTVAYLTPPLLRAMATREVGPVLPLLRYAFVDNTGDLIAHDVERLRRLAPACRVVGVYRVTDAGQPLAVYAVPTTWSATTAPLRVPIGTELAGPAVPLNPAGKPAAVGEVGELCFGPVRTGDLARRRADHLLEFAGIPAGDGPGGTPYADPLETVAALRDLPDVRDAVVTGYVDPQGRAALAAYVANPDETIDLGRLHQYLVTHLPAYLIPHPVVVLERLPLTSDGDYDLAALPEPDRAAASADPRRPRRT
jgi:non-ribosomal peptide synthetase component F